MDKAGGEGQGREAETHALQQLPTIDVSARLARQLVARQIRVVPRRHPVVCKRVAQPCLLLSRLRLHVGLRGGRTAIVVGTVGRREQQPAEGVDGERAAHAVVDATTLPDRTERLAVGVRRK